MTAPTAVVEGFSISHAQIMNGTDTFIEAAYAAADPLLDVYGVSDGSLDPDTDDYDNEGDDAVLSRWEWMNYATMAIQAGYISFPLISSMTGRPLTTTGTGADTVHSIDLWHEDSFNVDAKPMLLVVPSKDSQRRARNLLIGLYSVNFAPMTFDGPAYKDGLKVNYNGTALRSLYDETGVVFADGKARFGRLLSVSKTAPVGP